MWLLCFPVETNAKGELGNLFSKKNNHERYSLSFVTRTDRILSSYMSLIREYAAATVQRLTIKMAKGGPT